jgi:hypothetical protein
MPRGFALRGEATGIESLRVLPEPPVPVSGELAHRDERAGGDQVAADLVSVTGSLPSA